MSIKYHSIAGNLSWFLSHREILVYDYVMKRYINAPAAGASDDEIDRWDHQVSLLHWEMWQSYPHDEKGQITLDEAFILRAIEQGRLEMGDH